MDLNYFSKGTELDADAQDKEENHIHTVPFHSKLF